MSREVQGLCHLEHEQHLPEITGVYFGGFSGLYLDAEVLLSQCVILSNTFYLPFALFQKCLPNPSTMFTFMPHTCSTLKILMLAVTFHEAEGTEMPLQQLQKAEKNCRLSPNRCFFGDSAADTLLNFFCLWVIIIALKKVIHTTALSYKVESWRKLGLFCSQWKEGKSCSN